MSKLDQTLMLRAQEIAQNSEHEMHLSDALKQAALERYKDLESMAAAFASLGVKSLNGLRRRQYELPDQPHLFDVPSHIIIDTPEGPLVVPKGPEMKKGHVNQYVREGLRLHSAQRIRFKRFAEELEAVDDVDDDTPWDETRAIIRDRVIAEIESTEQVVEP